MKIKERLMKNPVQLQSKLVEMLQMKSYPSVSIVVSNENPSTNNQLLREKIKNAIKEVYHQLENNDSISYKKVEEIKTRLQELEEHVQYQNYLKGVGLYVSDYVTEILYFPFDVKEKVIVDDSFEIRDVLLTVNRTFQYDVLVLGGQKTRFFNGFGFDLQEETSAELPEGYDKMKDSHPEEKSDPGKYESKLIEKYVKSIDNFIRKNTDMNRPLIIAGTEKILGYFKQKTHRPKKILGEIHGNYEDATQNEIQSKIKEILNDVIERFENQLLERVKEDIDSLNYSAGIQDVWTAAAFNEGRILLTEKGYRVKAWSVKDDVFLVFNPEGENDAKLHEDAVDDIVEMVLKNGGESYFLTPGKLEKFDKILLTTRF